MKKKAQTINCSICGKSIERRQSNNARPINNGYCCHDCNRAYVITSRLTGLKFIKCAICGKIIPERLSFRSLPVTKGKCCQNCNLKVVIPRLIKDYQETIERI